MTTHLHARTVGLVSDIIAPLPKPATPAEQARLELRYDGPIPPWALDDLRRCPPLTPSQMLRAMSDAELAGWIVIPRATLKGWQEKMARYRRDHARARASGRDVPTTYRPSVAYALKQCLQARADMAVFLKEQKRRAWMAQRPRLAAE
ncbi:MAG: hypothetical protein JNK21_10845 [Rhodospirillaceae bacterium]|nr:hypothetical protein [Rhodospirillaceae bacterium]